MKPILQDYDHIVISTSGGKDSLVAMHVVHAYCESKGVSDKLMAVHADLGRMEWAGVKDLVKRQCDLYNIPLRIVKRPQGDLLDHVRQRGKWFSPAYRYCTSDHKRSQIQKVYTSLSRQTKEPLRILEVWGLRAQESSGRAKRKPFERNSKASTKTDKRIVDTWLPIHRWAEWEVWETIHTNNLPYHEAYDKGMSRLSCVFCMMASPEDLSIAARENPELLQEYIKVEEETGHKFKAGFSLKELL